MGKLCHTPETTGLFTHDPPNIPGRDEDMSKAGRKRKAGRRTASGRPSRIGMVPTFDRGTSYTQAMQALYGQDGSDAIGRAYRSGLLGKGDEAKALLDLARGLSNAYWRAYANGTYQCALGERTYGSVVEIDAEKAWRREQWLNTCLDTVRRMGPQVDRAFRQLVIDVNPDSGPRWLDALVKARQKGEAAPSHETIMLRAAINGLESLGG